MTEHILFVFEGEKTESQIFENLLLHFFNEEGKFIVKTAYKTDIYQLYQEVMKSDDPDDIEVFTLLREKNAELDGYTSKMFSQIYLFFDYDGHIPRASSEKVQGLLKFFNEETENGKLYISYPMIEAIKCFESRDVGKNFKDLVYTISAGTKFKQYVGEYAHHRCIFFHKYTQDHWNLMISLNLKKYNWITTDIYEKKFDQLCQLKLLEHQIQKYIEPSKTVSVIASFPLMLVDFYGSQRFESIP